MGKLERWLGQKVLVTGTMVSTYVDQQKRWVAVELEECVEGIIVGIRHIKNGRIRKPMLRIGRNSFVADETLSVYVVAYNLHRLPMLVSEWQLSRAYEAEAACTCECTCECEGELIDG